MNPQEYHGSISLHLGEEAIEAYALNRLREVEVFAFEEHVRRCDGCRERLEHEFEIISMIKTALTKPALPRIHLRQITEPAQQDPQPSGSPRAASHSAHR